MQHFWRYITTKQQLSLRNRETDESNWRVNISPLMLGGVVCAIFVLITTTLLVLMAYTSILDILPGYRTKSEKLHNNLTQSIMTIDSIERQISMMLDYNDPTITILRGSTPTLQSTLMRDTVRYDKSRVLPTKADSMLRKAMEDPDSPYSLANTKTLKSEAAVFSSPMRGNVIRGFDAPDSSYDIAIVSLDGESSVTAVESGTVISVDSHIGGSVSITLQHAGGYISVYKNLAEALVRRGQRVNSDTVLGRIGVTTDGATQSSAQRLELHFELWRDGTAIDPEHYIVFK